jgi:glycosyltransferase involved in cell wall biosynthesis
MKLSVVLATYNEESNIGDCLKAVKDIADEIVVVDGTSSDKTVQIAKSFGARVIVRENPPIFHINKQKALEEAKNDFILQLDADERVTDKLRKEIVEVINMDEQQLEEYQNNLPNRKLFLRHQKLIEARDGMEGKDGPINAFFIPRRNFFLGKYLKYGGTYPDPAIRLVRKGKTFFPAKDVHEQMSVEGRVGWLQNYMLHIDSPTFSRYIKRNSRYIDLIATELKTEKVGKNPQQFINFFLIKPAIWFLITQIRHKGILDGWQGIVFSLFSALRFPRAYFRYLRGAR